MSQFDNTATILSYTAYKAGRAWGRHAPVVDCSDGEIIDEEGRPLSTAPPVTLIQDSPVDMDVNHDVCAALMALREVLAEEAVSPVFEQVPGGALPGLDIELIAARGRGETFIIMRVRHAPPAP